MNPSLPSEISVREVRALQRDNVSFLLLDCRNQDEYDFVHLEAARLIPMDQLPQRVDELQAYADQRVVVYCHMGMRSQMVTEWLRARGFGQAQNMIGGIDAWSRDVDPTLPTY